MSGKEKDDATGGLLCAACFGLCQTEHAAQDCPLVLAALETCDCEGASCPLSKPRCPRRLLSLLLCLQLWDARMGRKLTQRTSPWTTLI
jgi:hypothetical protein